MTDARAQRREELFQEALELEPGRRAAFLARAWPDAPDLRAEVEGLLECDASAPERFLESEGHARTGDRVGEFEVLEQLGEGGMGVVYAARQPLLDRVVALKVIRPGYASPDALRRFRDEVQALGHLHHPGIAEVHGAGTAVLGGRSQPYLVMELVRGLPILRYAEEKGLDLRERLRLFALVCDAVHHAHLRGVIHRDIKPDNVLVTESDSSAGEPRPLAQPKVLDFGIARFAREESGDETVAGRTRPTRTGEIVGTLTAMSPEQVAGDSREIDLRSDVYSLGALCYELLAGRRPIELGGAALPEAARRIRDDEPARPSQVASGIPADVDTIVLHALEKQKERRYQSAGELALDIRRFLRGEAIQAAPASTIYRLSRFARRHRLALASAAAILVALVGGLLTALFGLRRSWEERDRLLDALAETRSVSDFLHQDLLGAVQPGEMGRDVSMREALDVAAENAASRFRGRPLVEAGVRNTIGETYRTLGYLERAGRELERSRELLSGAGLPEDHLAVLTNLHNRAFLSYDLGRFDEAVALYERALAGRARVLGEQHPETRETRSSLAVAYIEEGRLEEAEELLRDVVASRLEELGEDDPRTLLAMSNLSGVYWNTGQPARAAELLERTCELSVRALGPAHPQTLTSVQNLAAAYAELGRHAEAEELFLRVLEAQDEVFGREATIPISAITNVAETYRSQNRLGEADAAIEEAYARLASSELGEGNPRIHLLRLRLALVRESQGRLAEAEELCALAYEGLRELYGEAHPRTLEAQANLAHMLAGSGLLVEAEELLAAALELEGERGGSRQAVDWMIDRAACLVGLERFADAERSLEAAAERLGSDPGESPVQKARLLEAFAALYNSWDRPERLARWETALSPG